MLKYMSVLKGMYIRSVAKKDVAVMLMITLKCQKLLMC